jgi:hypothetical protein
LGDVVEVAPVVLFYWDGNHTAVNAVELADGTPAIIAIAGELRSAMDLVELAADHDALG